MPNQPKKALYLFHHYLRGMVSVTVFYFLLVSICLADQVPDIPTLKNRPVLDDYYGNVIFGYNIVNDTQTYASRFVGNKLNCTNCHRGVGTVQGQLPLNIAGIYPQWRAKNAQITDLNFRIRECFVYSQNGIMPPANAPEITAIKTYISYLSTNQVIGQLPEGRGVSFISKTEHDPNPANGKIVYQKNCTHCHGNDGKGYSKNPPVWGMDSYTAGSGMNNIQISAGFIKTKMSAINNSNLSMQQVWDVAAFLQKQRRPVDPGKRKVPKLLQDFISIFK